MSETSKRLEVLDESIEYPWREGRERGEEGRVQDGGLDRKEGCEDGVVNNDCSLKALINA